MIARVLPTILEHLDYVLVFYVHKRQKCRLQAQLPGEHWQLLFILVFYYAVHTGGVCPQEHKRQKTGGKTNKSCHNVLGVYAPPGQWAKPEHRSMPGSASHNFWDYVVTQYVTTKVMGGTTGSIIEQNKRGGHHTGAMFGFYASHTVY